MNLERLRYFKRRANNSPTEQLDSLIQSRQRIGAVEFCQDQLPDIVFRFHPRSPDERTVYAMVTDIASNLDGDIQLTYSTGHSIEELKPKPPPRGPLPQSGMVGSEIHIAPMSRRYGLEANLKAWTEHVMEQDAINDTQD